MAVDLNTKLLQEPLGQRPRGSTPWTLMDYFPEDFLLFIDESHQAVPQIRGMFHGDRARKETGGATDLFPYTHLLNQRLEREQKCAILTALWRVAMADGVLDKYEDQVLRRITELLRLEHSDFIAAKQAARPKED